MNAQVGVIHVQAFAYLAAPNRNWVLMEYIIKAINIVSLKTIFQKKSSNKRKFIDATGTKTYVDHIRVNN